MLPHFPRALPKTSNTEMKMADIVIIKKSKMVKKSNALARAKWVPESIWEPRIVAVVAAQVHKDDKEFKEYKIPIPVLLKMCDKSSAGTFYNDLVKIARQAVGRTVEIREPDGWSIYSLFSKCRYKKGEDSLIVRFDPDLKPHFLDLQKFYKGYPLLEFLALPSIYSQHIYEKLKSWDDKVSVEIDLTELHETLCTPPSYRKKFGIFRQRVLEKAHKDITAKTTMQYEFELIKQGQKVIKVRFVFGKKTMAKAQKKAKQIAQHKQAKNNHDLFNQALACSKKWKEQNRYCPESARNKKYCNACFYRPDRRKSTAKSDLTETQLNFPGMDKNK